ncbi:TPA: hypothetical protein ACOENN_004377, partial [Stenotrophomonas maltophilia]
MMQLGGQLLFKGVGDLGGYLSQKAETEEGKAFWADGGNGRALLHGMAGAAMAALGGADALNGAVSAAGAEKAKKAISDYLENNKGSLSGEAYQSLMEIGSAMVGGALGGSTGANIAVTGDRFNRQLHPDEERIIASLQSRGYSEEELRAVACVLVQCLLGRNLVDPQGLIASSSSIKLTEAGQALQGQYQSILDGMSEERKDQISSLLKGTGAFGYTPSQARQDAFLDTRLSTRLGGMGQAVSGMFESFAGAFACVASLGTGCAAAGTAVVQGGDNISAGLISFYTGRPTLTLQNQAWQAVGLSEENAYRAEILTGVAAGSVAGGVLSKSKV